MKGSPVPEHRVLITADIEDYSSRNDAEQRVLQSALSAALDAAADAADLDRRSWLRQVGGDGVFAVLPRGTDVAALMDVCVRELDAALGAYNRRRAGDHWTRMRLRLAVHVAEAAASTRACAPPRRCARVASHERGQRSSGAWLPRPARKPGQP
jgi:hypothetical protein